MSHSKEEIEKHVRIYRNVFIALGVLTGITVAVAYLHLPIWLGVIIALAIASLKGSLVAAFFMHLAQEKKIIFSILALTMFFFFVLLILPLIK